MGISNRSLVWVLLIKFESFQSLDQLKLKTALGASIFLHEKLGLEKAWYWLTTPLNISFFLPGHDVI